MKQILDYLEQLDLSKIEAKLYLRLLETGPISVKELAELIEVKRTTAYVYVDQLIEKGLLMKIVKGGHKYIAVNEPIESLQHLVQEKLKSAETVQEQFLTIANEINAIYPRNKDIGQAEIKYYKGKQGIMRIYKDALKGKELRLYANLSEIAPLFPNDPDLFENALKENRHLRIFEIYGDSPQAIKQFSYTANSDRYFYKFMPSDVTLGSSVHLIYDNKVAIIDVRGKIAGVVLHNSEHYINSMTLFDFIWKMLPEVK